MKLRFNLDACSEYVNSLNLKHFIRCSFTLVGTRCKVEALLILFILRSDNFGLFQTTVKASHDVDVIVSHDIYWKTAKKSSTFGKSFERLSATIYVIELFNDCCHTENLFKCFQTLSGPGYSPRFENIYFAHP